MPLKKPNKKFMNELYNNNLINIIKYSKKLKKN